MIPTLERNTATLLVGAESNHQSTLAYDILGRELATGTTVCLLAETQGEINVFASHMTLWLRARARHPHHAKRIVGLSEFRLIRDLQSLANTIEAVCRPALKDKEANEQIAVFLDLASVMLPTMPDDWRLVGCADLPLLMPNATVLVTAHHGPDMMPKPKFTQYLFDRVYRVQGGNVAMNIRVLPIKPDGEAIKLQGYIHRDGIVLIEEATDG